MSVSRRLARGSVLAATALLLVSCGRPGLGGPVDAAVRHDPATPPPPVSGTPVPPGLDGGPLWTAPFSSEPQGTDAGFVGVLGDSEHSELLFLGVDQDGVTRWSTPRNPSCTAFTVTRGVDGEELVVLLDSDAAPHQGLLATTTTAAAYAPGTGRLVWGPTEVPGTLAGPGLVFAALPFSVLSTDTGPRMALDAATGKPVADEADGDTVLHEYHGTVLLHRDGALRAVDPGTGEDLWTHEDLAVPPALPDADQPRVGYGPRPLSDSSPLVVLEWSSSGDAPELYTVHDLRTGRRLAELSADREPVLTGGGQGRAVVSGVGAADGRHVLLGYQGEGNAWAWEIPALEDERLRTLVDGTLYTAVGEEHHAIDAATGERTGHGDWSPPVAAVPGGPVLLSVRTEGGDHVLTAFPSS